MLETIQSVTSDVKGFLRVTNKRDSLQFLLFNITDTSSNSGFWRLSIDNLASNEDSPFSNNENILISFVTNGKKGQKGQKGDKGRKGDKRKKKAIKDKKVIKEQKQIKEEKAIKEEKVTRDKRRQRTKRR